LILRPIDTIGMHCYYWFQILFEGINIKQYCVLIVDNEPRILNFLSVKLRLKGYEVITAKDGLEAIEQAQAQEPDLIVLDVVMPKKDGFETLKELRSFSSVPVIMLSARGESTDKVQGFSLGADDYLAKPFSPDELIARIEALKRRIVSPESTKIHQQVSFGDLTIDFKKHLVFLKGMEIHLTRIEWLLLSELAQNAGSLLLYSDLLTKVWGPAYRDDVQILRTWISRLRGKIDGGPGTEPLIHTVAKTGYMINQPA